MFAVKGWNLDSKLLKPQTEALKPSKSERENGEKKSKKRKRDGPTNVTGGNVGGLWQEHVEGQKPTKGARNSKGTGSSQERSKKQKKQGKVNGTSTGTGSNAVVVSDRPEASTLDRAVGEGKNEDASNAELLSRKRNRKQKREDGETAAAQASFDTNGASTKLQSSVPSPVPPMPANSKLTPMQSAMRQKLVSARFRHLNQTLYTEQSGKALAMFDQNPEMFEDYHAGFRQQVDVWPENPVDNFIATIRARGLVPQPHRDSKKRKGEKTEQDDDSTGLAPLPRTHGTAIVADLGCGDARLASTLTTSNDISRLNLKLHSFDLASKSRLVTKADISKLPLADGTMDVAIFCLALMGTNWISFIEEAYRVLHWKGELWIAEIKSRFGRSTGKGKIVEHSVGSKRKQKMNAKVQAKQQAEVDEADENTVLRQQVDGEENQRQETDVGAFVDVLRRRGFLLKESKQSIDLSNKMFVKMEFVKAAPATKGKGATEQPSRPNLSKAPGPVKKPRFFDDAKDNEPSTEDEGRVLKPCLYKIR